VSSRGRLLTLAVFAVLAVAVIGATPAPADGTEPPAPLRVLFVGNSYTFYNDLPGLVRRLGAADEPPVPIDDSMTARPGYSLEHHWREERERGKIRGGEWDFVVLQEQSQLPLRHRDRMLEHAALLAGAAREAGARPVMYMTWAPARRPGMIEILADAYTEVAGELDAALAPVGRAWQRALERRPELELHGVDGSHPNPRGSYLAACVLYATLTGRDPRGLPTLDLEGLTAEDAAFLQEVASETVASLGSTPEATEPEATEPEEPRPEEPAPVSDGSERAAAGSGAGG